MGVGFTMGVHTEGPTIGVGSAMSMASTIYIEFTVHSGPIMKTKGFP